MNVPLETLLAALKLRDARFAECVRGLEDPANFQNPPKLAALQKERGTLQEFHDLVPEIEATLKDIAGAKELLESSDAEMAALAKADLAALEEKQGTLRARGEDLLVADDGLS